MRHYKAFPNIILTYHHKINISSKLVTVYGK
jgi:hypothetical protein